MATLVVLWPSLGGHWVEVWYLNRLRPRLAPVRAMQAMARVAVWFAGGILLLLGMRMTAMLFARPRLFPLRAWWIGGLAFVGIELLAHLILALRGRPSFYNGCG